MPGFRRKSPCEMRRDRVRKEQFLTKKKNERESNNVKKVTVNSLVQCNMDVATGVTTRSMVKRDDVERPRDMDVQSESDSILFSPETVSCSIKSPLSEGSPGLVVSPPMPKPPVYHDPINASLHTDTCDRGDCASSVTSTPVSGRESDLEEEIPPSGDRNRRSVKETAMARDVRATMNNIQREFDSKFEHLFKQYGIK